MDYSGGVGVGSADRRTPKIRSAAGFADPPRKNYDFFEHMVLSLDHFIRSRTSPRVSGCWWSLSMMYCCCLVRNPLSV
jgi:hypothetical protein